MVFIPTAVQPLKAGQTAARPTQRFEMTRLLVGDDPRFEVSSVEIDRGGLSYTVDTLRTLAAAWPSAELHWLVGADVLESFAKWKEPATIMELATLVVMQRAGGESPNMASLPGRPRLLATR